MRQALPLDNRTQHSNALQPISLWTGVALVGVGLMLRLFDLTGSELWLDEANAVIIGLSPLPELFDRLRLDSSPPLFYVMLHYWSFVFGDAEWALRLLSVLGGLLGIGALYYCGSRMFSQQVGALAAGFLAFAPAHVDYSQQVRQYTWLGFAVIVSTYFLWRLMSETSARHAFGYTLSTLCALMLHNHALYLLPVHGICALYALWTNPRNWRCLAAYVVTCLVYAPWLQHLMTQVDRMGYLSWLQRLWAELGGWGVLQVTGMAYIQGPPWTQYASTGIYSGWTLAWFGLLCVCLFSVGPSAQTLVRSRTLWTSEPAWLVGWCVLSPLALGFIASYILSYPNYIPGRTDQMVYPLFLLMLSHGFIQIPLPLFRRVAIFLVFLSFYVGLSFYFLMPKSQGAREATAHIIAQDTPHKPIVFTALTRASMQYYLERENFQGQLVSYPQHFARHLGNHRPEILLSDPEALKQEASNILEIINKSVEPKESFYLLYALHPPINTASFMKSAIDADARFQFTNTPVEFAGHRGFRFQLYTVERSETVNPRNTTPPKEGAQ